MLAVQTDYVEISVPVTGDVTNTDSTNFLEYADLTCDEIGVDTIIFCTTICCPVVEELQFASSVGRYVPRANWVRIGELIAAGNQCFEINQKRRSSPYSGRSCRSIWCSHKDGTGNRVATGFVHQRMTTNVCGLIDASRRRIPSHAEN